MPPGYSASLVIIFDKHIQVIVFMSPGGPHYFLHQYEDFKTHRFKTHLRPIILKSQLARGITTTYACIKFQNNP